MWKPGQLVTINHRTYRVIKRPNWEYRPCIFCEFKHLESNEDPCKQCCWNSLMPDNCYLKRVYKASDIKKEKYD